MITGTVSSLWSCKDNESLKKKFESSIRAWSASFDIVKNTMYSYNIFHETNMYDLFVYRGRQFKACN